MLRRSEVACTEVYKQGDAWNEARHSYARIDQYAGMEWLALTGEFFSDGEGPEDESEFEVDEEDEE